MEGTAGRDSAHMERFGHGDHRRAAELARSLGAAEPKIKEWIWKAMTKDFAHILFDKPLDEIGPEAPKPKYLN